MVFDKVTLISILEDYVAVKEQNALLTEQVSMLSTELTDAQAQLGQYQAYAVLLEDPEVVAAYDNAKAALNPPTP